MKKVDLSIDERVNGCAFWRQDAEMVQVKDAGVGEKVFVAGHGVLTDEEAEVLQGEGGGFSVERIPFELFRKLEEANPFVRCNGGEEEDLVFCKLRVFLRVLELQLCKLSLAGGEIAPKLAMLADEAAEIRRVVTIAHKRVCALVGGSAKDNTCREDVVAPLPEQPEANGRENGDTHALNDTCGGYVMQEVHAGR